MKKRSSRPRTNGFTCPLHPYQVFVWLILVFVQSCFLGAVVPALPQPIDLVAFVTNAVIFVVHLVSHIRCLVINPADENLLLNWSPQKPLPDFDRNSHRHVIEDQFCHICNILVGKRTKHCSSCNKCVVDFDHHCKWLNTCIGGRNYLSFLVCLSSAWLGCFFLAIVSCLCPTMYFVDRSWLRPFASPTKEFYHNVSTSSSNGANITTVLHNGLSPPVGIGPVLTFLAPVNNEAWLAVVFLTGGLMVVATGLIGHLLFFHIYLVCRGLSTYQLVVQSRAVESSAVKESSPSSRCSSSNALKCCSKKELHKVPKNQVLPSVLEPQVTIHHLRPSVQLSTEIRPNGRLTLSKKSSIPSKDSIVSSATDDQNSEIRRQSSSLQSDSEASCTSDRNEVIDCDDEQHPSESIQMKDENSSSDLRPLQSNHLSDAASIQNLKKVTSDDEIDCDNELPVTAVDCQSETTEVFRRRPVTVCWDEVNDSATDKSIVSDIVAKRRKSLQVARDTSMVVSNEKTSDDPISSKYWAMRKVVADENHTDSATVRQNSLIFADSLTDGSRDLDLNGHAVGQRGQYISIHVRPAIGYANDSSNLSNCNDTFYFQEVLL